MYWIYIIVIIVLIFLFWRGAETWTSRPGEAYYLPELSSKLIGMRQTTVRRCRNNCDRITGCAGFFHTGERELKGSGFDIPRDTCVLFRAPYRGASATGVVTHLK
jgi:hypothetical protein